MGNTVGIYGAFSKQGNGNLVNIRQNRMDNIFSVYMLLPHSPAATRSSSCGLPGLGRRFFVFICPSLVATPDKSEDTFALPDNTAPAPPPPPCGRFRSLQPPPACFSSLRLYPLALQASALVRRPPRTPAAVVAWRARKCGDTSTAELANRGGRALFGKAGMCGAIFGKPGRCVGRRPPDLRASPPPRAVFGERGGERGHGGERERWREGGRAAWAGLAWLAGRSGEAF